MTTETRETEKRLFLQVIEIYRSDDETDFLIADHDAKPWQVMLGNEAVYGQVADRLTADVIVRSVNCFPDLARALERLLPYARTVIHSTDDAHDRDALTMAEAALRKAHGDPRRLRRRR